MSQLTNYIAQAIACGEVNREMAHAIIYASPFVECPDARGREILFRQLCVQRAMVKPEDLNTILIGVFGIESEVTDTQLDIVMKSLYPLYEKTLKSPPKQPTVLR